MSFWAYMLKCSDGSFYTGHTENLPRRMAQHEQGEIPGYTSKRRPVTLVWSQDFVTREEALASELRVKAWNRRKKEALASGDWEALREAGKKNFGS